MSGSFKQREVERGIPRKCRCGAGSVIKTADTLKNPGRLFHCCPYGSKEVILLLIYDLNRRK